jgi:hypothetical protein
MIKNVSIITLLIFVLPIFEIILKLSNINFIYRLELILIIFTVAYMYSSKKIIIIMFLIAMVIVELITFQPIGITSLAFSIGAILSFLIFKYIYILPNNFLIINKLLIIILTIIIKRQILYMLGVDYLGDLITILIINILIFLFVTFVFSYFKQNNINVFEE